MLSRFLRGVGSFVFWSYERGTWQYDLMVGLILAFVFAAPWVTPSLFTDRPRPAAAQVVEISSPAGSAYRIEAEVLAGSARSLQLSARQVLEEKYSRRIRIQQMRPILDAQGRVRAYEVITAP